MTNTDHLIWSNYDLDLDDWRDYLLEEYPNCSDDELTGIMYERNADYLDDERLNLSIQLSQPILVIGNLGLWNGRHSGYKIIKSGNIRDCLYSESSTDYSTWYVDKLGDLRCDAIHHDGINHLLYRAYKPEATDAQIARLQEKIYHGTVTRADICRVTYRLGDAIGAVYGWSFPHFGRRTNTCLR